MMNILGIEKMLIGRYGWHIGKLWFLEVGCTSRAHTRYRRRLANDWERPRALTAIIMYSDKTSLIKA
jgi:hypothetical protein